MRIFAFLLMFSVLYFPLSASAGNSKYMFNLFWPNDHWQEQDFQPYRQDPLNQQNAQWEKDDWEPRHWIADGQSAKSVIDGFFRHGLLVDQDENCEGVPVLEVGESFLHLSPLEKRRIAAFMNYAYNMTGNDGAGLYYLTYRDDDNVIGVYTQNGLQLH